MVAGRVGRRHERVLRAVVARQVQGDEELRAGLGRRGPRRRRARDEVDVRLVAALGVLAVVQVVRRRALAVALAEVAHGEVGGPAVRVGRRQDHGIRAVVRALVERDEVGGAVRRRRRERRHVGRGVGRRVGRLGGDHVDVAAHLAVVLAVVQFRVRAALAVALADVADDEEARRAGHVDVGIVRALVGRRRAEPRAGRRLDRRRRRGRVGVLGGRPGREEREAAHGPCRPEARGGDGGAAGARAARRCGGALLRGTGGSPSLGGRRGVGRNEISPWHIYTLPAPS